MVRYTYDMVNIDILKAYNVHVFNRQKARYFPCTTGTFNYVSSNINIINNPLFSNLGVF